MVHLNSPQCYVAFGDQYFWLAGQQWAEETSANVGWPKTLFLVNSVYTNNVFIAHVHVWRPWWYYKQSFMLFQAFLAFKKIAILMLSLICPKHSHSRWVWPENKNTVNLKNASCCNYAFTRRLNSYTFTKKPRLHFGKSFTLNKLKMCNCIYFSWQCVCPLLNPLQSFVTLF